VAFECLTGRTPFVGGDVGSALARVGTVAPLASSVLPGLDPRVDTVLARALEADPMSRRAWYPSATAFVAALAGVSGAAPAGVLVPAQRTERMARPTARLDVGAGAGAGAAAEAGGAPIAGVHRSSGFLRSVVGAVAVAAAMVGAYVGGDALVSRTPAVAAVQVEDVLAAGVTLSAGERALLAQGPLAHVRDCEPQPTVERGGVTAAVTCVPTYAGVDQLLLRQSAPADLARVMNSPSRPAGSCATRVGVDSTWERGPLDCYDNSTGAVAALWFGFADSGVSIVAVRNDSDNEALYRWFTSAPWPSPAGP
jgi:hypothetical protein